MDGSRNVSLWIDSMIGHGDDPVLPRAPIDGDLTTDVCIVGAGLTGLWTAYYLAKADATRSITVVEKEYAGFGASGRNGGWCSALFPRSAASLERTHGFDAAVAMRRAMVDTVDEVGRVASAEGIDCDFVKGGTVVFARDRAQLESVRSSASEAERYGVDSIMILDDAAVARRFGVTGVSGGAAAGAAFDTNCARVQPARLTRGLARVVEGLGVRIFEDSPVMDWSVGQVRVRPSSGPSSGRDVTVRARSIIIATEAYSATLPRSHRRVLPLYSLMIATEPLPAPVWDQIGIRHGETFSDFRHLLIYGQRTADDRIAFGGRGARYHWASAIQDAFDRDDRVFAHLVTTLRDLFPAVRDARITHRWGGPIGVPRDWHPTVSYNPRTGVGFSGGYVGDGLSTTNLAGRTMASLVNGERNHLTRLPWVNHRSPLWEVEPARFVGVNVGLIGMGVADREERITGKPSWTARMMGTLTGH